MEEKQIVKFRIHRYNPDVDDEPYFADYDIPYTGVLGILDVLQYIFKNIDSTLAYRWNCRTGQCGSCAININGIPGLACRTVVDPAKSYVLEPLSNFPVIRDLVVDLGPGFKRLEKLRPYLERTSAPDRPERLTRDQVSTSMDLRSCIECFSCYAACPVVESARQEFPGPIAMRELASFEFDPRDEGDRVQIAVSSGIYDCTSCSLCKEVCIPKHIDTRRKAIEGLRARAVERDMGPLQGHQNFIDQIKSTGYAIEVIEKPFTEQVPNVIKVENPIDELIFFPGCLINLRLQHIGHNIIEVLKQNHIQVHIPKDFVCCTSVAFRTGSRSVANDMVLKNTEYFEKLGVNKLVGLCPGCMSTIKQDWPIVLHEQGKKAYQFEPFDINEYLIRKIGKEKLNVKDLKPLDIKVTYHDPCHLNRSQEISEEPRELLRLIPGIEFIDVEQSDRCCGAGGGVRAGRRELSEDISGIKLDILTEPNPDIIATSCSFCFIQIADAIKRADSNVKVMNVMDLLAASYRGDKLK
ncbi:MAG: fumarate reductase (CoM/CoB) subunit TfrB [Candidatus Hodarchaeales archaeon]|jgi:fumarate reductase (CoM/CoB) subunit B